jgi:hypothetical protein
MLQFFFGCQRAVTAKGNEKEPPNSMRRCKKQKRNKKRSMQ